MISCELKDITIGCLLKDIIFMDPISDISELKKKYGLCDIVAQIVCPSLFGESAYGRMVEIIDRKFLELQETPFITAFASPFLKEGQQQLYYDPSGHMYDENLYFANQKNNQVSADIKKEICSKISHYCLRQHENEGYLTGLMDLVENLCSFLSVDGEHRSMFETAKLRAGLAACIYQSKGEEKSPVLVCSLDFLGIKDFKFQEAFSEKLGEVSSASFYIDLFRENVLDDFLDQAGLTRCNLIFSGGRHLHLFLPNTDRIRNLVESHMRSLNDWLVGQYQLDLYVSYGMYEASNLDHEAEKDDLFYLNIFTQIANQKAIVEASRYTPENLVRMNLDLSEHSKAELLQERKKRNRFMEEEFADRHYFVISADETVGIPIGPNRYAYAADAPHLVRDVIRIYCLKQEDETLWSGCKLRMIRIWHEKIENSSFSMKNPDGEVYGMLRMDIDNFRTYMLQVRQETSMAKPPEKMELSKQFAFFLRRDVPRILKNCQEKSGKSGEDYVVSVIHEGADDMFVFGRMDQLVELSSAMYMHYKRFTQSNISFCAGISIFNFQESLTKNANLAQELMDQAKMIPGKNGIVLKDSTMKYKWEEFIENESFILDTICK